MANRSLDLTIISAKGLNKVNLVGKMDVYAVVYIAGAGNHDQKQKTHVDKDGDSNPTWNYPMRFQIDESLQTRLTLVVKIKAEGMFGDKDVGEVHVPVKELLEGGSVGGKPLQFVTYQVRKPSGQPKGEISFSYRFGVGKFEESVVAYPAGKLNSGGKVDKLDEHVMAYPVVAPVNNSLYPPPATSEYSSIYPPSVTSEYSSVCPPQAAGKLNSDGKVDKLDEPVMAYPVVASEYSSVYPPPVASEYNLVYPPPAVGTTTAGDGIYPLAGGEYYSPPAGYPQPLAGYSYLQQLAYDGYPPTG